jgi:hypothetical protein
VQREAIARSLGGIDLPVLNLGLQQASGAFLDPRSNPALRANIVAATRPVFEAFDRARLGAASQGIASRRDLLESNLIRDLEREVGDVSSRMIAENFARERGLQQQAPELIDAAVRLSQVQPELLAQAGLGQRQLEQLEIEERLRAFEEAIESRFRPLLPLASLIQGTNIGQQTRTSAPSAGPIGGGITGALGGAAGGGALASAAGQNQDLGAILGALAGGAAGAFG